MTRNGEKISEYPLSGSVNTGIRYGADFEGWQAAVKAGLDMERWVTGGYDQRFMAKTIAWYRLSRMVALHSEAARQKASERKHA